MKKHYRFTQVKNLMYLLLLFFLSACSQTIYYAIRSDNVSKVKKSIQEGVDINVKGKCSGCPDYYTPFKYACQQGNLEIVKLLIENGGNLNDTTGFYYEFTLSSGGSGGYKSPFALTTYPIKVIELLLNSGAKIPESLLAYVCSEGNFEKAKFFIDHGADINGEWNNGTPLMHAMSYLDREMIKLLQEKGAKIPSDKAVLFIPLNATIHFNVEEFKRVDRQILYKGGQSFSGRKIVQYTPGLHVVTVTYYSYFNGIAGPVNISTEFEGGSFYFLINKFSKNFNYWEPIIEKNF